ncbi:hypothetical protein T492DRAFT_835022 [Pavlovales sp. CCMP2436]|nr:hypothetical protein T492DRAFT_835022 [Pavlovales sp. CCMP2436]
MLESLTVRAVGGKDLTVRAIGGKGGDLQPVAESVEALRALIARHAVVLVAVGDGMGSELAQRAVSDAIRGTSALFTVVSEAGASAYSACALADAELATVGIGERGAVSLARRVLDPLAEFVKVC